MCELSTCIQGYKFHSAPRCFAYSTDNPFFNSIQHQKHSGVGMYCKNNINCNILNIPNVNIESIICQFKKPDMIIVVIYQPAQYHLSLFKTYITKLCNTLSNRSDNIFLLGDWNHDELKTQTMSTFTAKLGYVQCVTEPTSENGTLIDHVYKKKTSKYTTIIQVIPLYFSAHEAIHCAFVETYIK